MFDSYLIYLFLFIYFEQVCNGAGRRKREAPDVSPNATLTSPVILVGKQSTGASLGKNYTIKDNSL